MLGGIIGGALKAIGLEEIAPFAQIAVGMFTGDYMSAFKGLTEVIGKFTGNDFLSNLSQMNPLGGFGGGAGGILGGVLGGDKFGGIMQLASGLFGGGDQGSKIGGLFDVVGGFLGDKQAVSSSVSLAQSTGIFGRV